MKNVISNLFLPLLAVISVNATAAEAALSSVVAVKAEYKNIADEILYPARISNIRNVGVPSEIDGKVESMKVVLGQFVSKGMLLMTIRNSDPVYDYRSFEVRSPLSGIVTQLEVNAADQVGKGKVLLTIGDNSKLKALVNLTGEDASFIRVGYPAVLTLGKEEFALKVKAFNPQLDPVTGTSACELELINPSHAAVHLVPGSIAEVRFLTNNRKALVIAQRAIVYRGRDLFVIRIQNGNKAQYVPAKIVRQGLGTVEVESPIKPGDSIVVNSQGFVADGEIVNVEGQEG